MKLSLAVLLVAVSYTAAITLDEAFKSCKEIPRNELEPCIVQLINDMKPLIQEGIRELGWDVDDCHYDSVSVDQKGGMNHVQGHFYSGTLSGLEEFQLTYLKIDYENRLAIWTAAIPALVHKGRYNMDARILQIDYENRLAIWTAAIPELVHKGRYNMDARILQFPLYGNGTFWNRMEGLHLYGVSKLEVVDINGEPHLQEKDTELTYSCRKMALRLNNLYDGNSIMQEAASAFLNTNLDVFWNEYQPADKATFRKITGNHVNKALSQIKLDDLAGSEFIKQAFSINQ